MYPYLKMLLHLNGAIPTISALQSFWERSARQKLEILQNEMQDTKYDPKSIFSELNNFYQKLIQLTLSKCPNAFKKNELLHSWHNKLGKTCQEFRENELSRWKVYVEFMDKYDTNVLMNLRTFDEKKVRNCFDLKGLCYEYYAKYALFSVTGYEQLIKSVLVNQDPLVGKMAQTNPEGSIRHSNFRPDCPRLLASLDP
jgi:hypothetical protein